MGKAVLISIRPKWCELIASGKKTVEVRKTRPKMETPFIVYIYCTQATPYNPKLIYRYENENGNIYIGGKHYSEFMSASVIGEFVCDEIYREIICGKITDTDILCLSTQSDYCRKHACLSERELYEYCNGKPVFGWQISDLKIYDKPKELSEFWSWQPSVEWKDGYPMPTHFIKRAPQSFMYVEELI